MSQWRQRRVFRSLALVLANLFFAGSSSGLDNPGSLNENGRSKSSLTVNEALFPNESNRFVGVGGEIMINSVLSGDDPTTPGWDPDGTFADPDLDGPIPPHLIQRLDIGDRLVGIGVTQTVECTSCPPGPGNTRALGAAGVSQKCAARAFQVIGKESVNGCFKFTFGPLSPEEFSATVQAASDGAVVIPAESIPAGTMVVSFDDPIPNFTLEAVSGSPGRNWTNATDGSRHWNIGKAKLTDFWMSSFPSDDLGMLPLLPAAATTGTIRFGLSLLSGGIGLPAGLEPVQCYGPNGPAAVDFCLSGSPTGTQGVNTPFPIGLKTEVRFHPLTQGSRATAFKALPAKASKLESRAASAAQPLCCSCDTTGPMCSLTAVRTGPPAQIDITAQDSGVSGLLFVDVLQAENAAVPVPSFGAGAQEAVTVTATKIDQSRTARVELRLVDVAGNVTVCDPVLTEVIRGTGQPTSASFQGVPAAEGTVEVHNGKPGLKNLEILVNGVKFRAAGMRDGELRTIDVSRAMLPGNQNVFTLKSSGKPSSSATVLIREGGG